MEKECEAVVGSFRKLLDRNQDDEKVKVRCELKKIFAGRDSNLGSRSEQGHQKTTLMRVVCICVKNNCFSFSSAAIKVHWFAFRKKADKFFLCKN